MTLHVTDYGGAGRPPLVVMHGLLGSARNWAGTGKRLAEHYHVLALDLPNHGASPALDPADYPSMVRALLATLDGLGLERVTLMGHSLGGKVAMCSACWHPSRVERLLVLDIAPRQYVPDYRSFDAMQAVDLGRVSQRTDAETQMSEFGLSDSHRLFLLTNLVRTDEGTYRWAVDLELLRRQLPLFTAPPLRPQDRYEGPTRFIVGGGSRYWTEGDLEIALRHFPRADVVVLPDSGHNVHIEGGAQFLSAVQSSESP